MGFFWFGLAASYMPFSGFIGAYIANAVVVVVACAFTAKAYYDERLAIMGVFQALHGWFIIASIVGTIRITYWLCQVPEFWQFTNVTIWCLAIVGIFLAHFALLCGTVDLRIRDQNEERLPLVVP